MFLTRADGSPISVDIMAPTIVQAGAFRLFFFSSEETRIHVHVANPDGEAKFLKVKDAWTIYFGR
ncbi:MAG: hypothetical protein ACKOCU_03725 [Betaproteobacteria bacterium]